MSYRTAVCIRVDDRLLARFDTIAQSGGYTRSEAIREAIRRFCKQDE